MFSDTNLGDEDIVQFIFATFLPQEFVPCGMQSPAREARQRVNAGGTLGKNGVGNFMSLQLLLDFSEL